MTFRARGGAARPRTWDERDRRTLLMNVGFGLTVLVALLLLAVAFGAAWYGDHLASAATVDGQSISKDQFRRQLAVDKFRVDYQTRRIRTLLTAGHIRTSDAQARLSALQQYSGQANTIALEQLIDGVVMDKLAPPLGVTVADADVDEQLTEEATTPELRHAWVIAVAPTLAPGETAPTDAEKAAAKAKADQALADVKSGKDWATVAKSVSTDSSKDQGGDLGYLDKNVSLDQPFLDALMAAAKDTPTAVVEGDDGTYRIGRVTDIIAPVVDATLQQQVQDAGISISDFRGALRIEAMRTKLSDAYLAPYLKAAPQREVQEIYLAADIDPSTGAPSLKESEPGAVKIRHILYAPNKDVAAAASLPPDDPAWKAAQDKAEATYQRLLANPQLFASIVATDSDDAGSSSRGGVYWFTKDDSLLEEFSSAIFQPGLKPGQLLPPVKTSAGWHVIQILHFAPDLDWAKKLKTEAEGGSDFAALARDNSDASNASKGGDMGWIARGQLDSQLEGAIFGTKIGGISDPVKVAGDGIYLFKVNQEQTRAPDAAQKATIESTAFSKWYSDQKATFTITRDPSITDATTN
jgi:parvulin-like peptidyl-prolyl isomerase